MNLVERDRKIIWHPFSQPGFETPPIPVVRGEGTLLFDEAGKSYIDAISSWWVITHGHAHPKIVEAISSQAQKLCQAVFASCTHEPAVVLAEKLIELLPTNQKRIFFSDDGSTAVEVALKLALQYWYNRGEKRTRFVALKNGYHGDTFGAMSVAERSVFNSPFESLLFKVDYIDPPRAGAEAQSIEELKAIVSRGDVAAFIFEPLVQGAAGMQMHSASGLSALMRVASEHEVLTIADEVMTGFGRTGKMFASDHLSEAPDLIALSKGITGGALPLGVTSCTSKIYETFLEGGLERAFLHGHSYTANPLACAAAVANLELLERPEVWDEIRRIEARHEEFVSRITKHPLVACARTRGVIAALEVKNAGPEGYGNPARQFFYDYFISKRVLLRPLGNVIYILPPYCISNAELDTVYATVESALDSFQLVTGV